MRDMRGILSALEDWCSEVRRCRTAVWAYCAGSIEAYDALALECQVAGQMLKARSRAGLTQDAVAERMGTTKSAISRLESAGKQALSLATLKCDAMAVGCESQVRLVPRKATGYY